MLRRGCRLQANKASVRKTNHYALGCMRARRRVVLYVIGVRCGITSWLACRPVALGYLESDHSTQRLEYQQYVPRVGWPGESKSYGEPRRTR